MFEEINSQIEDINARRRELIRVQNMLDSSRETLKIQRQRLGELEAELEKTDKNLKKLESISFTAIISIISGSKQEKLEKETGELLSVKLKYEECSETVRKLELEIAQLVDRKNQFNNLEYEYKELIKRKENFIMNSSCSDAEKLIKLAEKTASLKADLKEINEARSAGSAALSYLKSTEHELDKAKDLGTLDLLGGGTLTTYAKHCDIDDAKDYAMKAQDALRVFQRELKDVLYLDEIQFNISSFDKFADFFFDGFIADWVVQSHIKDSLDSVNRVIRQVDSIVNGLDMKALHIEHDIDSLIKEKENLVASLK